jgi:hypothetical protein
MTMTIEINCATGETVERLLTEAELKIQSDQAKLTEKQSIATQADKDAARQVILDKLGITQEEASLLLS